MHWRSYRARNTHWPMRPYPLIASLYAMVYHPTEQELNGYFTRHWFIVIRFHGGILSQSPGRSAGLLPPELCRRMAKRLFDNAQCQRDIVEQQLSAGFDFYRIERRSAFEAFSRVIFFRGAHKHCY